MRIKHGTRTAMNRAISMALSVVMAVCIAHTTTIVHGISTNAGISGTVFETSGSGPEYSRWGSPGNLRTMGARFTILRFEGGVENVNSTEDGDVHIVGTLDVYEDGNMPYNNNALGSAQSPNFKYFGTNAITIRRMYEHIRAEVDSNIAVSGADAMDRTVRRMLDAMSSDGRESNNGLYGKLATELSKYKKNHWSDYYSRACSWSDIAAWKFADIKMPNVTGVGATDESNTATNSNALGEIFTTLDGDGRYVANDFFKHMVCSVSGGELSGDDFIDPKGDYEYRMIVEPIFAQYINGHACIVTLREAVILGYSYYYSGGKLASNFSTKGNVAHLGYAMGKRWRQYFSGVYLEKENDKSGFTEIRSADGVHGGAGIFRQGESKLDDDNDNWNAPRQLILNFGKDNEYDLLYTGNSVGIVSPGDPKAPKSNKNSYVGRLNIYLPIGSSINSATGAAGAELTTYLGEANSIKGSLEITEDSNFPSYKNLEAEAYYKVKYDDLTIENIDIEEDVGTFEKTEIAAVPSLKDGFVWEQVGETVSNFNMEGMTKGSGLSQKRDALFEHIGNFAARATALVKVENATNSQDAVASSVEQIIGSSLGMGGGSFSPGHVEDMVERLNDILDNESNAENMVDSSSTLGTGAGSPFNSGTDQLKVLDDGTIVPGYTLRKMAQAAPTTLKNAMAEELNEAKSELGKLGISTEDDIEEFINILRLGLKFQNGTGTSVLGSVNSGVADDKRVKTSEHYSYYGESEFEKFLTSKSDVVLDAVYGRIENGADVDSVTKDNIKTGFSIDSSALSNTVYSISAFAPLAMADSVRGVKINQEMDSWAAKIEHSTVLGGVGAYANAYISSNSSLGVGTSEHATVAYGLTCGGSQDSAETDTIASLAAMNAYGACTGDDTAFADIRESDKYEDGVEICGNIQLSTAIYMPAMSGDTVYMTKTSSGEYTPVAVETNSINIPVGGVSDGTTLLPNSEITVGNTKMKVHGGIIAGYAIDSGDGETNSNKANNVPLKKYIEFVDSAIYNNTKDKYIVADSDQVTGAGKVVSFPYGVGDVVDVGIDFGETEKNISSRADLKTIYQTDAEIQEYMKKNAPNRFKQVVLVTPTEGAPIDVIVYKEDTDVNGNITRHPPETSSGKVVKDPSTGKNTIEVPEIGGYVPVDYKTSNEVKPNPLPDKYPGPQTPMNGDKTVEVGSGTKVVYIKYEKGGDAGNAKADGEATLSESRITMGTSLSSIIGADKLDKVKASFSTVYDGCDNPNYQSDDDYSEGGVYQNYTPYHSPVGEDIIVDDEESGDKYGVQLADSNGYKESYYTNEEWQKLLESTVDVYLPTSGGLGNKPEKITVAYEVPAENIWYRLEVMKGADWNKATASVVAGDWAKGFGPKVSTGITGDVVEYAAFDYEYDGDSDRYVFGVHDVDNEFAMFRAKDKVVIDQSHSTVSAKNDVGAAGLGLAASTNSSVTASRSSSNYSGVATTAVKAASDSKLSSVHDDGTCYYRETFFHSYPGHPDGGSYREYVATHDSTAEFRASVTPVEYTTKINVQVFRDPSAGVGNEKGTAANHNTIMVNGAPLHNGYGAAVNGSSAITFHPYVQMYYGKPGEANQLNPVAVLADNLSSVYPVDYAEVGYTRSSATDNLDVTSKQWSTHTKAVNTWGKDNVLPGGAMYNLGISEKNQTTVGGNVWFTFVDSGDAAEFVNIPAGYTYNEQKEAANTFFAELESAIEAYDVVQMLEDNSNKSTANPLKNGKAIEMRGGQQLFDGNQSSSGDKYHLLSAGDSKWGESKKNRSDLDVIGGWTTGEVYYRVWSDVYGTVYVAKGTLANIKAGGGVIGTISKTESINDLLAKSTEIQELDAKTKVVTNFMKAIDRNKGNDTTLPATIGSRALGKTWYNEACDGIYVCRYGVTMQVGFNSNAPVRVNTLDPKMEPPRSGQVGLFKDANASAFWTSAQPNMNVPSICVGYLGKYKGVTIKIREPQKMYTSKTFFIPNASVTDLH